MGQKRAAIIGGAVATAGLIALIGYAGTHQPLVCAASLAVHPVEVTVTGHPDEVHAIRFCTGSGTGTGSDCAAAPVSARNDLYQLGVHESPATWTFVDTSYPRHTFAVAYDSHHRVLADERLSLTWSRANPSSACDTSMIATPVSLDVP